MKMSLRNTFPLFKTRTTTIKKWKCIPKAHFHSSEPRKVLFVSGMMFYDIKIILKAIKQLSRLIKSQNLYKMRLRLHPHGSVGFLDNELIKLYSLLRCVEV